MSWENWRQNSGLEDADVVNLVFFGKFEVPEENYIHLHMYM